MGGTTSSNCGCHRRIRDLYETFLEKRHEDVASHLRLMSGVANSFGCARRQAGR